VIYDPDVTAPFGIGNDSPTIGATNYINSSFDSPGCAEFLIHGLRLTATGP
jgi:hypothetical protein